ncbi:MAG: hypothetical protein QNJ54_27430 [Prochloraceae cyanobacterium]|nr:hypothetical protein [Prochloraceae cyanobacterium]
METLKTAETSESFQAFCHKYAYNALKTKDEKVREALEKALQQLALGKSRRREDGETGGRA